MNGSRRRWRHYTASQQEPQRNRLQAEQAVRDSLTTFRALAQHLAGIQGQKVVVWIIMGFPDRASISDDIDQAVRTLGKANIVVESVDPRLSAHRDPRSELLGPVHVSEGVLRDIAERTGGKYYPASDNNLAATLQRAANDRVVSYELGYYAADDLTPGLQPFEIKCKRPGVTLRVS